MVVLGANATNMKKTYRKRNLPEATSSRKMKGGGA